MIYVIYYDDVTRSGFLSPPPLFANKVQSRRLKYNTHTNVYTTHTHTSQSLARFPGPFNPPRRRLRIYVCDAATTSTIVTILMMDCGSDHYDTMVYNICLI